MKWKFYQIANCTLSSGGIQFDVTEYTTFLTNAINKLTEDMDMYSL